MAADGSNESQTSWVVQFGERELVIRQRYEVISIVNDILIGLWFVVGSIFFFSDSLAYTGTWFFVIGSVEMLIRPTIRMTRRVHLSRLHPGVPGSADAAHDF